MNQHSLISVLMPVYNGERTIARAVRSLLVQTHQNWEAIIVDDGSNDQTLRILSQFKDARIRVFSHERNCGRGAARQTALDQSEGDFIAFLDADDFYHPNKLRIQWNAIRSDKRLSLVSCQMGSFDENPNLVSVRTRFPFQPVLFKAGDEFMFSRAGSMIRRDAIGDFRYDLSLNYAEDTDFIVRVISGKWVATVPDLLYFYSEFESLSKKKILIGSLYSLKVSINHIRYSPWAGLKRSAMCSFKLILKLTLLPFLNIKTIVRQRGKQPNDEDYAEFISALGRIAHY